MALAIHPHLSCDYDMTWDKDSVRQLRQLLELTQTEFAELLGCRQQTISEWEQGLYAPANAYGKLLSQIKLQTPNAFQIDNKEKSNLIGETNPPIAVEELPEFRPFDPAVD